MPNIPVQILLLDPKAKLPEYATPGSAGFDLVAMHDMEIAPLTTALMQTGIAVAVPEGFELQIRPKSGVSLRSDLRVANSPGTVDSDYRDEVMVILSNTNQSRTLHIVQGKSYAQGVICPVYQAEWLPSVQLDETERKGGFGSTNK